MLSWKQSGAVDNYIIAYNHTVTSTVEFTGLGDVNVSATVSGLPTSGAYYCISVAAVSGHLRSDEIVLCNYTGDQRACVPADPVCDIITRMSISHHSIS